MKRAIPVLRIALTLVLVTRLATAVAAGPGATPSADGQREPAAQMLEQAKRAVAAEDLAGAETLLWKSLTLRPGDLETRFLLARILSWRRDFSAAYAQFDRLLAHSPDNVDYLLGKAQTYLWDNQPAPALPLLKKARERSPAYFEVWQAEVQALLASGTADDTARARALTAASSSHLTPAQSAQLTALVDGAQRAGTGGAKPTYTDIALGSDYQHLDNKRDAWTSVELDVSHNFADGAALYGSAVATERFDKNDRSFTAGAYYHITKAWLAQFEARLSPTHEVLPKWSLFGRLSFDLGAGWNLAAALRRNQYREPRVDIANLGVERYWSVFRAAWSLYASSVEGESPVYSHAADLDYYYNDLSYIGVSAGRGKEADYVDSTRLLVRRTNSLALRGRHWLNQSWAVEYTANRSKIGGAFTRYGVRLGIRYRY